jgi:hypothetical protein
MTLFFFSSAISPATRKSFFNALGQTKKKQHKIPVSAGDAAFDLFPVDAMVDALDRMHRFCTFCSTTRVQTEELITCKETIRL